MKSKYDSFEEYWTDFREQFVSDMINSGMLDYLRFVAYSGWAAGKQDELLSMQLNATRLIDFE